MQPLISPVDHESRNHSYNHHDEESQSSLTERTPLLRSSIEEAPLPPERQSPVTAVIVATMVILLVAGVIISIYLLVEQDRYMPPVPPIDGVALRYVPRESWDTGGGWRLLRDVERPPAAQHLVVVHTNTEECDNVSDCCRLLQAIQREQAEMPYNFLVSTDGSTYEALGWKKQSPVHTGLQSPALVLAFIGNFTDVYPSVHQMEEARSLCDVSVSRDRLSPSYTVVGRDLHHKPTLLFKALSRLREWDWVYSDPIY